MFNDEKSPRLQLRERLSVTALGLAQGVTAQPDPRIVMRERHLPNVPLVTHTGRPVRFYDDLVKDRRVAINFMYTVCSNICTPMTRNVLEASKILAKVGVDVQFYSISLTPLDDDPPTLRKYMNSYGIDMPNWTFLTGKPVHIDQVRNGLGLGAPPGEESNDLSDHAGLVRVGDEAAVRWGHASGLISGRALARMIRSELS